jgi:hypothetical protein
MRTAHACLLAAGLIALAAPAANAGGWGGRYGVVRERSEESASAWSASSDHGLCPVADRRDEFARDLPCARPAEVALSDVFFAGTGGVGPFPDFETGGGGGGFILVGGEAHASAFASASARISVRFNGHGHGGGGHTGGCGCKK